MSRSKFSSMAVPVGLSGELRQIIRATPRWGRIESKVGKKLEPAPTTSSTALAPLCTINDDVKALLRAAINQLSLSARAYDRILKVARTIADLGKSTEIEVAHVAEAIQYRTLDRKMWM